MAAYIEMSSGSLVIARTLVTTFRLLEGISGLTGTVRVRPWPTRLAAGAAVFMAGLGLTVLAGWAIHVPRCPRSWYGYLP
jgi:hypothetical protein